MTYGEPGRWRKKPVVIEAMRFGAYTEALSPASWNDYEGGVVWRWLHEHGQEVRVAQQDPGPAYALIPTLEGAMRADIGDWIIRGVQGEFYPCKPDIFRATYEQVGCFICEPDNPDADPEGCAQCDRDAALSALPEESSNEG